MQKLLPKNLFIVQNITKGKAGYASLRPRAIMDCLNDRELKITLCADKRTSKVEGTEHFTNYELEGIIGILIKRLSKKYGIKEIELVNHLQAICQREEDVKTDPERAGDCVKTMFEREDFLRSKRKEKKVVDIDDLRSGRYERD